MSLTLPAMKGRMGETDYYILSMKAGELVRTIIEPKDMPGWDHEKIEEIYQRKIQFSRIRNQIVPYLVNNKSRFFGAIIAAIPNFEKNVQFQSIKELHAVTESKLDASEREAVSGIGLLTISGGAIMLPLDGQHRIKALEFAIYAKDERQNPIPNLKPHQDLSDEDISVILVPYDPIKARNIFTRVNRYARRPSSNETIVTDDDNIYSIIARKIANGIGGRLVKYTTPNLTIRDPHFTTLATLQTSAREILKRSLPSQDSTVSSQIAQIDETQRPPEEFIDFCTDYVRDVWNHLLSKIEIFADATSVITEDDDDMRREIRKANLLGKPATQDCLVRAYMALTEPPTRMTPDEACRRLNAIPWLITNSNVEQVWQNVLWTGDEKTGKMLTTSANRTLATNIIAYMAGEKLSKKDIENLLENYRDQFPDSQKSKRNLPPKVSV